MVCLHCPPHAIDGKIYRVQVDRYLGSSILIGSRHTLGALVIRNSTVSFVDAIPSAEAVERNFFAGEFIQEGAAVPNMPPLVLWLRHPVGQSTCSGCGNRSVIRPGNSPGFTSERSAALWVGGTTCPGQHIHTRLTCQPVRHLLPTFAAGSTENSSPARIQFPECPLNFPGSASFGSSARLLATRTIWAACQHLGP